MFQVLLCAACPCIIPRCRDLQPHRSRTHPLIMSVFSCCFVGCAALIPVSGRIIQPLYRPQIFTQTTTTLGHMLSHSLFHSLPAHMKLQNHRPLSLPNLTNPPTHAFCMCANNLTIVYSDWSCHLLLQSRTSSNFLHLVKSKNCTE